MILASAGLRKLGGESGYKISHQFYFFMKRDFAPAEIVITRRVLKVEFGHELIELKYKSEFAVARITLRKESLINF